jgi:hypothetical protein
MSLPAALRHSWLAALPRTPRFFGGVARIEEWVALQMPRDPLADSFVTHLIRLSKGTTLLE